jgi:predicted ABC-type transport system involved in lysophospholipase L1 biosynthesis ATPase subunit
MIEVGELARTYHLEGVDVAPLQGVTRTVQADEYVAVTGPSGSDNSTLLHVPGAQDVSRLSDHRRQITMLPGTLKQFLGAPRLVQESGSGFTALPTTVLGGAYD